MLVGLRRINGEIHRVLNVVMTVGGKSHKVCATALDLYHIADSFLKKSGLCQNSHNKRAVLNKGNCSVL